MSLAQLLAAGFTPDLAIEAVNLLHRVISTLEIVQDNGGELVLAFTATPDTHDALCAFAAHDDREDDECECEGLEEDDARDLSRLVEPTPPPAPRIDVVAPEGARWLGRVVPPPEAADQLPRLVPLPMALIEGRDLVLSALISGGGILPQGPADWLRLQGTGRGLRALPPPPLQVAELHFG